MSPRKAKNVVAITPGGDITMDHIMGFYALYTVPNEPVSTTKLNRLWVAEGLPHDLIPHERDAKHNFMHAVRQIETRSRNTDSASGERKEIEVDPVTETKDRVVYQVTSLIRDSLNEVINHPKAMRVVYDKNAQTITSESLDKNTGLDDAELEALLQRVQDTFDSNATKIPGARVRASIRGLMKEVGATNVRKKAGGVYFVPKDAKESLDSLDRVIEGLWKGEGELHLIFAANAEGEKELVERHFTVNVSEEVDALMAEATEALKGEGRKLRKDRVGNMLRERAVLGNQRSKYAELLGMSLEETETKLDLLDQQLEKLVVNMGADE
jgi:hypothetical protein